MTSSAWISAWTREKVGAFPTQPPGWWKQGDHDTATEAAFENAWRPFEREYGPIFQGAAMVYQQVAEDRFLDREMQLMRFADAAKKKRQIGK